MANLQKSSDAKKWKWPRLKASKNTSKTKAKKIFLMVPSFKLGIKETRFKMVFKDYEILKQKTAFRQMGQNAPL